MLKNKRQDLLNRRNFGFDIRKGILAVRDNNIKVINGITAMELSKEYDELFRLIGDDKFQVYNSKNNK